VDESQISLRAKLQYMMTESFMGIIVGVTTAVGTALVLYVGARHVLSGDISLGELLLVMSYIGQLYGPLKSISNKLASMQRHLASAERAFSLLDEPTDVPERANARPIQHATGHIQFNNVAFAYSDGPRILSDLRLEITPGTRVGIAGRTGAGKTTLVSLLMRFYDVSQGAILLDGIDLRDYRLADLRGQFAMVLQEPVLFSTTIAENIAYGRTAATADEIVDAAKAANAHDFIVELPDGYETTVGERGMRLSGGERQRISLARAFLKDAPLLILDEPTSSVDINTECSIMDAMSRLMVGRTTFMIAHRLSTLDHCDMILVVEDGRVTEGRPNADGLIESSLLTGGTNR
jgi:ATP-binding cassette subfamily B protein